MSCSEAKGLSGFDRKLRVFHIQWNALICKEDENDLKAKRHTNDQYENELKAEGHKTNKMKINWK